MIIRMSNVIDRLLEARLSMKKHAYYSLSIYFTYRVWPKITDKYLIGGKWIGTADHENGKAKGVQSY